MVIDVALRKIDMCSERFQRAFEAFRRSDTAD